MAFCYSKVYYLPKWRVINDNKTRKIRFLLSQIEIQNGREMDFERVTLEHVCPYNPDAEWHMAFGEGINDIVDRSGGQL